MAIRKVSGSTAINRGVNAAVGQLSNMAGVINAVTVTSVLITDASYNTIDDTAVSSAGGYLKIIGSGFKPGCTVYIGGSPAASTTYVSPTEVRATTSVLASNVYLVYVLNTDNTIGIKLNALAVSGTPSWNTGATLSDLSDGVSFSVQLSATSDSSISYSLAAGSSVPSGTTFYSNGLFTGTVSGLSSDTTYSFTVNAVDVELQDTSRTFSVTVGVGDLNFRITPLLINGESNTWVTDASSNNILTTVSGNTIPTAFSPYNSNWSGYFDGSNDDVRVSGNNNLAFGTGDFTIEMFFYNGINSGDPQVGFIYDGRVSSGPEIVPVIAIATATRVITFGTGAATLITSSAITLYKWYHLVVSRVSGSTRMFLDGVQTGSTATDNNNYLNNTDRPCIGTQGYGSPFFNFQGFISNLRVLKGTGTIAPTVPTAPLTAITNTQLLLFQDKRIKDNSNNNFAITKATDLPTVSSFAPFVDTDTTTGSGYFDSSGDFVASTIGAIGSGDFTIEFWTYKPAAAARMYYFTTGTGPEWGDAAGVSLLEYDGNLALNVGTVNSITIAPALALRAWHHIAVVRSGSTVTTYVNGTAAATTLTSSANLSGTLCRIGLGATNSGGWFSYYGYMTDFRILVGTALYTANFTPPTAPLTAITNTRYLTLQSRVGHNNNTIIDQSGNKYLSYRPGQSYTNVTQGSFSPFSPAGWSALFDGSGDYLAVIGSSNLAFGTGDFTIECFFYARDVTTSGFIYDSRTAGNQAAPCIFTGGGVIQYYVSGGTRITSGTIVVNRWYHLVVSRVSGNTRMFLDGTQAGSTYVDATNYINNTNRPVIGTNDAIDFWFNGYISNLRVLNGTGYTSVTVPNSPLTAITNTQLLTLQDNRFKDNSTNAYTITQNGDARIQAFSPFRSAAPYSPNTYGGSAYFDGNDPIQSASTTMPIVYGAANTFTVEGWLYPTTSGTKRQIVGDMQSAGGTNYMSVVLSATEKIELYWYDGAPKQATSVASVVKNQWNYFAIVVSNNTITIYVNSTTAGQTGTTTLTNRGGSIGWAMGAFNSSEYYTGYMSGIRWTTGTARTISSIPTAPPTPDKDTTLLMNFNTGGVVDMSGRMLIETTSSVTGFGTCRLGNVAKYGRSSLFFSGSYQWVTIGTGTPPLLPTLGDFTAECWIYPTAGDCCLFCLNTAPSAFAAIRLGLNSAGTIGLLGSTNGSTHGINTTSSNCLVYNAWQHIAVVRSGGNIIIYHNGVAVLTTTAVGATTPLMAGTESILGAIDFRNNADFISFYQGYIDDFRVSNMARYTGAFTPPTATFFAR